MTMGTIYFNTYASVIQLNETIGDDGDGCDDNDDDDKDDDDADDDDDDDDTINTEVS